MKKLLLFGAICCLSIVSIKAQETHFGVKAGLNVANITQSDGDAKVGFAGGLYLNHNFGSFIGIGVEALYSNQGTQGDIEGYDLKVHNHYLNIPILARFDIIAGLSFNAGVQPGFLMKSKGKLSSGGSSVKSDIDDTFKTFDLSIPVGLSYQFPIGLLVDARYNIGATNVIKDNDGDSYRNSVFQFTLGWSF